MSRISRLSSRHRLHSFLPVVLLIPVFAAVLAGCMGGGAGSAWRTDSETGVHFRALSAQEKTAIGWEGEGKLKAYVFRAPGLLESLAANKTVHASFVVDGAVHTLPLHLWRISNVTRQVGNESVTFPQRLFVQYEGAWRGFVSEFDGLMAHGENGDRNVVVQTHAPMLELGSGFQDGDFVSYSWVDTGNAAQS